MKSILYFLFLLIGNSCLAQKPTAEGSFCFGGNNLSGPGYIGFYLDTLDNPNNIWQIGKPHKNIFDYASSPQNNVLITDTVNTYPVNDTSRFIIEQSLNWFDYQTNYHHFFVIGEYFVNTDSLTDFGKIEISMKNSNVWYEGLSDTSFDFFDINNSFPKPILSGNSNGWEQCEISFLKFGQILNLQWGDTMLLRFSFITDSIQTNKDGLMFGCFYFQDAIESVKDISTNIPSTIYPNPAFDHIVIKTPSNQNFKKMSLDIFEITGRKVKSLQIPYQEQINIPVNELTNGMYYYEAIYDNKAFSKGKFSVIK